MILRLTIGGFPLGPELAQTLERLRQDPLLSRCQMEIGAGGLAGAVAHYRQTATPQLLIVEEQEERTVMQARLEQLAEVCVKGTQVIVVGSLNDIATYRRLLSLGIGDYLVGPVTPAQLTAAIETLFADPATTPKGRLIAFAASRGGAGSSALAHNTAWLLSRRDGEEVILLDLDLAFGTVGLAFNVDPRQTVGELLSEPERIDAQLVERVLVRAGERLQLLPSPGLSAAGPPIAVDAVDRLLDLLRRMASVVVVDLPHHWAPFMSHLLEMADEAVVVTPPDLAGLRDSKALLDGLAARRCARQAARLVINKADLLRKSQLSAKDFEEALKIKPALTIPFDPLFGEALNEGQMVAKRGKVQKLTDSLNVLAHLVAPRSARPAAGGRGGASVFPDWLKRLTVASR